jgi:hypothetical protein
MRQGGMILRDIMDELEIEVKEGIEGNYLKKKLKD